jgi:hypothetical protein
VSRAQGFGVQGSGFRNQGSEWVLDEQCRVWDISFGRVQGLGVYA